MFVRGQLVIQRDEHTSAIKNGIGGNQPLRLIRHDDSCTLARIEASILKRAGQWQSDLFEIGIGQSNFFAVAIGFDEADFAAESIERITQGCAQTRVLAEIEHQILISPQRGGNTEKSLVIK